jgi:hydrogenase maturation protease
MNLTPLKPRIKLCERSRYVFVVGIGSPHGDDRAGWEVIDRLARDVPRNIVLRKASVPHDLLDWLEAESPMYIIDASSDKVSGVRRFDLRNDNEGKLSVTATNATKVVNENFVSTSLRSNSTHQIDLLSTLELAATLERLPRQLTLWTVSIEAIEKNGDLSAEAQELIEECVSAISKELRDA